MDVVLGQSRAEPPEDKLKVTPESGGMICRPSFCTVNHMLHKSGQLFVNCKLFLYMRQLNKMVPTVNVRVDEFPKSIPSLLQ